MKSSKARETQSREVCRANLQLVSFQANLKLFVKLANLKIDKLKLML